MAKSSTTVFSSVTVAAAAAYNAGCVEVDLSTYNDDASNLYLEITNGSTPPGSKTLIINWAFSKTKLFPTYDETEAPVILDAAKNSVTIKLPTAASALSIYNIPVASLDTDYLYVWYSHEAFDADITLDGYFLGNTESASGATTVEEAQVNAWTNRSGSITSGGVSQTLAAANASRRFLFIQNISNEDLWFNETTAAAANSSSIKLAAGNSYEAPVHACPRGAITIVGATTGSKFVAKEG